MPRIADELEQRAAAKEEALADWLRARGRVAIGFSGGVDSAYLAVAARRALGAENVLAIIGRSASYPAEQWATARRVADSFDVAVLELDTDEMSDPRYAANPANRCYFCKTALFDELEVIARAEGIAHIVYGANLDDLGDHRPGAVAARERGVRAPLLEAGLDKADIRAAAQQLGVPNWDKPAMACLSSRVPYGTAIDAGVLEQIWRGESFLRGLGFRQLRVRHHGDIARIEVPLDDLPRVVAPETREAIQTHFKSIGYLYVTLDLAGFKSGSMNAKLPIPIVVRNSG